MGPAPMPTLSPELTWRSTNAIAHLRSASDSDDETAKETAKETAAKESESVQAEVLNLLVRLRAERGLTFVMVSHDLAVISHICESLLVMQQGRSVEALPREALASHEVAADYTRNLLRASEGFRR